MGQWDVTSGGAPSGTNEVEVVAGGCAIRENWRGTDGSIGVSLTGFDARRAEWEQIYFDSGGGTLDLRGSVRDGVMTLTQQSPGGLDRFRWIPLGDDQVRQLWENSGDGGGTWSTVFDGLYRRR